MILDFIIDTLKDGLMAVSQRLGDVEIKGNLYLLLDSQEINLSLSNLFQKENTNECQHTNTSIDTKIRVDKTNDKRLFCDFFLLVCNDTKIKDSTRKNYLRTLATLKSYAPNASFEDISKSYFQGYELYLHQLKMKSNTILKHLKQVKKAVHLACRQGYIKSSAEELFSLCSTKPKQIYKESLTGKEVLTLQHLLVNNFDCMVERDREILAAFLFSCWTGLRFSDVSRVTYSDMKKIRNKRWLILTMQKTSRKVFVPIEQLFCGRALTIMKLFKRTRGKLFHLPSNAICNRVLKRLYSCSKLRKKNISFHTGRHTAATLLLYYQTPLTTIQGILGHTHIRTTEIYADLNEATIYNSIQKLRFKDLDNVERRILRNKF